MFDKLPGPEMFEQALGKKWGPRAFTAAFIVILLALFGAVVLGTVEGFRAIFVADGDAAKRAAIADVAKPVPDPDAPPPSGDPECDNLAKSCPPGATVLCKADVNDSQVGVAAFNANVCIIDLKTHRVGTAVEIFGNATRPH